MNFRSYSVDLKLIEESDIEMIRQWRNQEFVRSCLFDQREIGESDQVRWFESIRTRSDCYYFVFSEGGNSVGLVFIKNISDREAEAGIFIGDKKYLGNGRVCYGAVMGLNDFAFNIVEALYCWILHSNQSAIRMNSSIGYVPVEDENAGSTNPRATKYRLSKDRYESCTKNLRRVLSGMV